MKTKELKPNLVSLATNQLFYTLPLNFINFSFIVPGSASVPRRSLPLFFDTDNSFPTNWFHWWNWDTSSSKRRRKKDRKSWIESKGFPFTWTTCSCHFVIKFRIQFPVTDIISSALLLFPSLLATVWWTDGTDLRVYSVCQKCLSLRLHRMKSHKCLFNTRGKRPLDTSIYCCCCSR